MEKIIENLERSYVEIDGIRLIYEGNRLVGWYRPMMEEEYEHAN